MSETFTFDPNGNAPLGSADTVGSGSDSSESETAFDRRWWFVKGMKYIYDPGTTPLDRFRQNLLGPTSPVYAYDILWLYEMWNRMYYMACGETTSRRSNYGIEPYKALERLEQAVGTDPSATTAKRVSATRELSYVLLDDSVRTAMAVISGSVALDGSYGTRGVRGDWSLGLAKSTVGYRDKTGSQRSLIQENVQSVADPGYPPFKVLSFMRLDNPLTAAKTVSFRDQTLDPGEPTCTFRARVPYWSEWYDPDGSDPTTVSFTGQGAIGGRFASEDCSRFDHTAPTEYWYPWNASGKTVDQIVSSVGDRTTSIVPHTDSSVSGSAPGTHDVTSGGTIYPFRPFVGHAGGWLRNADVFGFLDRWPAQLKDLVTGLYVPPGGPLDFHLDESDPYGTAPDWTDPQFRRNHTETYGISTRAGLSHVPLLSVYVAFLCSLLDKVGLTFRYSVSKARVNEKFVMTGNVTRRDSYVASDTPSSWSQTAWTNSRNVDMYGTVSLTVSRMPGNGAYAEPPHSSQYAEGLGKFFSASVSPLTAVMHDVKDPSGTVNDSFVYTYSGSSGSSTKTDTYSGAWSGSYSLSGHIVSERSTSRTWGRAKSTATETYTNSSGTRPHHYEDSDEYSAPGPEDDWSDSESHSDPTDDPYVPVKLRPFAKSLDAYVFYNATGNVDDGYERNYSYTRGSSSQQTKDYTHRYFYSAWLQRICSSLDGTLEVDPAALLESKVFGSNYQFYENGTRQATDSTDVIHETRNYGSDKYLRIDKVFAVVVWDPDKLLKIGMDCPTFPDQESGS